MTIVTPRSVPRCILSVIQGSILYLDSLICDCKLEPRQNLYDIKDGVVSLAFAVTINCTICQFRHVYQIIERGGVDCALRRRENDPKRSYDQVLDAPLVGYENKMNVLHVLVYLYISSIPCMRYPCLSGCCAITTAIYIMPRSPLARDHNAGSSTQIPY